MKYLSIALMLISWLFALMAALATPIAIVTGVYDWAVVDMEFKHALWEAVKTWITLLFLGVAGWLFFWFCSEIITGDG